MRLFPIYTWNKGIRNFDHRRRKFSKQPWAQGVILLACVVVAMLLANLPFTKEFYHNLLETDLSIYLKTPNGDGIMFPKNMTIESFINDILMTVFFFTVGLEIRREMKNGELSSMKKALMPVVAAFGGVLVPALIYTVINHGSAAASGWGIPTATDIAFAVGILSILGDKVPDRSGDRRRPDRHTGGGDILRRSHQLRTAQHRHRADPSGPGNEQAWREAQLVLFHPCDGDMGAVLLFGHPLHDVGSGDVCPGADDPSLQRGLFPQEEAPVHKEAQRLQVYRNDGPRIP